MQPPLAWTTLDGTGHQGDRAVRHEQAFERRHFGPQPRTLEGVSSLGPAQAHVVLGEQPSAFVTRVPVVAPERGHREFEREDRRTFGRVRPRRIRSAEVAEQGREILRVRQAPLKIRLAPIEGIRHGLDIGRHDPARRWRRLLLRGRRLGCARGRVLRRPPHRVWAP